MAAEVLPPGHAADPDHQQAPAPAGAGGEHAQANGAAEPSANPTLERLNRAWAAVQGLAAERGDASGGAARFTTWTRLLAAADHLGDISAVRSAYDAFLAEYPLCYGYWKRYAEAERQHGSSSSADATNTAPSANGTTAVGGGGAAGAGAAGAAAAAVYQRALAVLPHSCELWVAYAALLQAAGAPPEAVRGVYEAGVAAAGSDYTSGLLWDRYLAHETTVGSPAAAVAALYARVLGQPVRELEKYHTGLTEFAAHRSAAELLPQQTVAALKAQLAAARSAAADVDMSDAAAAAANGAPPDAGATSTAAAAGAAPAPPVPAAEQPHPPADDDAAVKAAWLAQQAGVFAATQRRLAEVEPFEAALVRPYWHIKPLDAGQLVTWAAYLDWAEGQAEGGDAAAAAAAAAAVRTLYERCLVPCASYPEFWCRYVRWCDRHSRGSAAAAAAATANGGSSPDAAAAVLQRALTTFCKRSPTLGVFAARFYEARGDVAAARQQYARLLAGVAPDLLEVVVASANFEHRASGAAAAKAVYEEAIQQQQQQTGGTGAAASSSSSEAGGQLHLLYAHFLKQVLGDLGAAREVLRQGLQRHPGCKQLWEGALWTEESQPGPDRVQRVLGLYEQLLAPKVAAHAKQQAAGRSSSSKGDGSAAPGAHAEANGGAHPTAALPDAALEELSQRCVEFADAHADLQALQAAQQRHAQLFMLPVATNAAAAAARKQDACGAADGAAASKAQRADGASTAAVAAAAAAAAAVAADQQQAAVAAAAASYYAPAAAYGYHHQQYAAHYGSSGYYPQQHAYGAAEHAYAQAGYSGYGGY